MTSCSVEKCKNSLKKDAFLILFNIPTDLYFQKLWKNRLGRKVISKPEKYLVCSSHFDADDLEISADGKTVLKANAIPSKNLPTSNFPFGVHKSKKPISNSEDLIEISPDSTENIPQSIETNENNKEDIIYKYRLLLLEFELLQNHVEEQESHLLRLKEENSALNSKLSVECVQREELPSN